MYKDLIEISILNKNKPNKINLLLYENPLRVISSFENYLFANIHRV